MGNGIGISPAVMVNRLAHEARPPPDALLAEVATLRMKLTLAQAESAATDEHPDPAAALPANGAEIDRLI
ncbi:MAG: hypothetical protein ABS75_09800 [Pelagibacterium sp. SCN 63-23]|nr:MAG: hypothetical protein ABS75_09800 [Pelagibacterium sp. SCN 63-23]